MSTTTERPMSIREAREVLDRRSNSSHQVPVDRYQLKVSDTPVLNQ